MKEKKKIFYSETQEYKNWKSIIKGAMEFPTEKFFAEIVDSHNSRKSRTLSYKSIKASVLIKASSQDVNLRSRCVELSAKAKRIRYSVSVANEAFKDFVISNKMVDGSTQSDRNRSASSFIKQGLKVEADLDSFIEVMEDFIEDIDQTGWALKRMMEGIVIASKPENIL